MRSLWRLCLTVVLLLPSLGYGQDTSGIPQGKEDPAQRDEAFRFPRAYPFERIPEGARLRALEHARALEVKMGKVALQAAQPRWQPIGPFTVGGRIRTVVHHPRKDGWVYIGAAAGGIWRTTDGGQSWIPLFDDGNSLSFGALAIDPNNPDILYAATGEMSNNIDSYLGAGIFKSTDGGQSWTPLGLTHVGAFSKIEVHPLNSNLIVAGATKSAAGFWRSSDGGQTWERTFVGSVTDISLNPRDTTEFFIGVAGRGVYRSSDGGRTWELRSTGLPSPLGRVCVQQAPSDPNILYALVEQGGSGGTGAIYKSTNRGQSWQLSYQGQSTFFNGQGWYNAYIVIHPTNPNLVLAGGIDIYRTDNGGQTWTNVTYGYSGGNVHVDQHAAAFNPLNPSIVYAANDGGMYRSTDAGLTWTPINNGLAVTQFYAMAIDQSKDNVNYGGTQDNGTLGNRGSNWGAIAGGDGFFVVVDPDNPDVIYGEFPNGDLWKRNLATGSFQRITTGIDPNDPGYWSAPLVMDPTNSQTLYHGRRRLYATYNGGALWQAISPPMTASITAIGVSAADPNIIYIGTARGEVWRTSDAGQTWENVGKNGLPNRFVTDFALSESDPGTVYVTLSGFGAGHVWRSTDTGRTWQDISVGLPDIPVNAIVLSPLNEQHIFVGTDIGVFASLDGGATWLPYGVGLPRAPVVDLAIHFQRRVLRAATHGRSMWEVPLPTELITEPAITAPAGGEVFVVGAPVVIAWHGFTAPVRVEFSADDGQSWELIAENVTSTTLRWTTPNRPTLWARIRVSSQADPQQVRITPTFTLLERKRGAILQSAAVVHIPYGIVRDDRGGLWTTSFSTPYLYKLNATTLQLEKEVRIPGGDSLYTDLTMDRARSILYVHKLNSTASNASGIILVLDTTGRLLGQYPSPARYPTGLAFYRGKLLVAERDGQQFLYVLDPQTGAVEDRYENPFRVPLGPRGLTADEAEDALYHISTDFSGNSLTAAYLLQISLPTPTSLRDSLVLSSQRGTSLNARGIEYDPSDKSFWVTDFEGNIYKIAGFRSPVSVAPPPPLVGQHLFLAPQPVREQLHLWFRCGELPAAPVRIALYDLLGQHRTTFAEGNAASLCGQSWTIGLASLTPGTYWCVLSIGGTVREVHPLLYLP
ncbi:Xyloglucanase [bacterium HR21]|nr:Xyloglucanase [bacterium HR21]